jgi:hypothetical protein
MEHLNIHFSTSYCYFLPLIQAAIGYVTNAWNRFYKEGLSTLMVQDCILRTASQYLRRDEAMAHSTEYETCCCVCTFTCCPFCFRRITVQTILRWWRTWR